MEIFSVNRDIEYGLKSDNTFLFSHLSPYLSVCASNEVSGQAIEPYLIGKHLSTYESIGQTNPVHLVSETINALDAIYSNPTLLSDRICPQSVLSTDSCLRPISGLPAIILLTQACLRGFKGNVFCETDKNTPFDHIFETPTYLTYSRHLFCAAMDDIDIPSDINPDSDTACLYIPYQLSITDDTDTQFMTDVTQQDWLYRLIRHYTQGHYSLRLACKTAESRPYAFGLIVAAMIGVKLDRLKNYKANDDYINLSNLQRYEFITTVKPLVETIAFDFIDGRLNAL